MARPYDANVIADLIIEKAASMGKPVSNLKLQKILYYLQARFITEYDSKLFGNEMQKWKYGPVIPDVYFRFDHYGAANIKELPGEVDFSDIMEEIEEDFYQTNSDFDFSWFLDEEEIAPGKISSTDEQIIVDTLKPLLEYGPFDLVDRTHEHNAWKSVESEILRGVKGLKYTEEEILEDFTNNKKYRLWS